YPVLVAQGFGLLNAAASSLGQVAIGEALVFPNPGAGGPLLPLIWLAMIYYGFRLFIRLAYSLFRLLVALVFGPVAIILWAIPQTEWVTWFWLRELLAWATTPLLVTACLALAIPLANGRSGFLPAAAFGIAGMMAAYDLVGLLGMTQGGGRPRSGHAWPGRARPRSDVQHLRSGRDGAPERRLAAHHRRVGQRRRRGCRGVLHNEQLSPLMLEGAARLDQVLSELARKAA